MSELRAFLTDAANTTSREVLLAHRFSYELKLASARRGVDLRVYRPDVDRDGFDLILEGDDSSRKIQTKVVYNDATKATWSVHKTLLRPLPAFSEHLGFEPTIAGAGLDGGFVVISAGDHGGEIHVSYRYLDANILFARRLGLLLPTRKDQDGKLEKFFLQLMREPLREQVAVPAWMLVEVPSVDALIALMGLHSILNVFWPFNLREYGGITARVRQGDEDLAKGHLETAREELQTILGSGVVAALPTLTPPERRSNER